MLSKLVALLVASTPVAPGLATSQGELDSLANAMGVRMAILDNKPATCPKQTDACFLSELDLTLPPTLSPGLARDGFRLYFSSVSPVIQADSDSFTVRLINGDLHVLEPKAGARLQAGKTYPIKLWSQSHFFSEYYVIPNMFLVSDNLDPRVIEATRPATDAESGLEMLPFVAPMTNESRLATQTADDDTRWQTPERAFALYAERAASAAPDDIAIIPTPTSVRRFEGAPIHLTKGARFSLFGVQRTSISAALADLATAGVAERRSGAQIRVRISRAIEPEGYRLTARKGVIDISAGDAAGAAYALESLAQQAAHEGGHLRPLEIVDTPRAHFRGLHIDLARNFHRKDEVLKLIEQMGRYKLNKLHLHLGDDEGWRLEIRSLPELTQVGAYRCYDPSETRCLLPELGAGPARYTPVNGYLSRADYINILRAATARGIEVIPSFDMPGHSRAAIKSMEVRYRRLVTSGRVAQAEQFRLVEPEDKTDYRSVQNYNDNTLNVCLGSTYAFIGAVIDELIAMHAAAGVPLKTYHMGADETAGAWKQSPSCKAFLERTGASEDQLGPIFIASVSSLLRSKGVQVAAWSDGLQQVDAKLLPPRVQSDIWGDLFTAASAEAHRAANRGWRAVIAVPNLLYFDMPYAPHPLERGYDWGTRGVDTFKVFSFLPDNLPANASVMKDIKNKPTKVEDISPLAPGRELAGSQAQLWSETVRSDAIAEYMLFPRLLAFAERSWHRAAWEPAYRREEAYAYGDGKVDAQGIRSDWARFAANLPEHLRRLDEAGVFYRLAPPGARIRNGMLEANSELPAQAIEYRLTAGSWQRYRGPVPVSGPVELRTRSYDGRRTSRIVEVPTT